VADGMKRRPRSTSTIIIFPQRLVGRKAPAAADQRGSLPFGRDLPLAPGPETADIDLEPPDSFEMYETSGRPAKTSGLFVEPCLEKGTQGSLPLSGRRKMSMPVLAGLGRCS